MAPACLGGAGPAGLVKLSERPGRGDLHYCRAFANPDPPPKRPFRAAFQCTKHSVVWERGWRQDVTRG